MSLLSGAGTTTPNTNQYYDVTNLSITVAAGATGGIFPVTGSTKTFKLNSAIGSTFFGTATMFNGINGIAWAKQSGNSTDTYVLVLQSSIDAGSTWTTKATLYNGLGGANTNKVFGSDIGANLISGPFTSNQISLRLAITDATDPTTDAFTLQNIRCTYQFYLAM